MLKNKKAVTFFFGAGAETNKAFNLPEGKRFLETVIPKREEKNLNLIEALRERYNRQESGSHKWSGKYRAEVICEEDLNKSYKAVKSTYGYMEKYFHTLIDPNKYGQNNFWKIINHYWFAFFSVFTPLYTTLRNAELSDDHVTNFDPNSEDYYKGILKNLPQIISKFYCKKTDWENIFGGECGYYKRKFYNDINYTVCGIITTNYTPLVHMTGIEDKDIAFINGELKYFEYPHELIVEDITQMSVLRYEFSFPFLMVQSAVKPIVAPQQVIEMKKAYDILDKTDYLVMIGYGINADDNHINSFIVDFIRKKENFKLIYCVYDPESNEENVKDYEAEIKKKLRLGSDSNKIKILKTNGDADKLFESIGSVIVNQQKI